MKQNDYVVGAYVAEGIVRKIYERINSPRTILCVPTPYGTSFFRKGEFTPGQVVARLCERYNVDGLTVANWLKRYADKDDELPLESAGRKY